MGLAGLLGLWEFYQMCWPGRQHLLDKGVGFVCGLLLFLPPQFVCSDGGFTLDGFLILHALFLYAAIRFLASYGRGRPDAPKPDLGDQALLLFGVVYLPFSLRLALEIGLLHQLAVLLAVVASDTGAYYVGNFFGKHKIWPKVSPNKSLEGALGGLLGSTALLGLFGFFAIGAPSGSVLGLAGWALAGFLLSLASQTGDFFESAIKRHYGVKDSSRLIPGHGGVLDRLDSLVFALPVYVFICLPLLAWF
jgi:phosphatidate cytidylyltransferase